MAKKLSIFFFCAILLGGLQSAHATTLADVYGSRPIQLLVVPGHDNDPASGGTQFAGVTEAELNLELGWQVYQLFQKDSHFNVGLTRSSNGYNDFIASYIQNNRAAIIQFRDASRATNAQLIQSGQILSIFSPANAVTDETSIKLYGINKWANENGTDLMLNIHFNDYPERSLGWRGQYSGFVVFIPERQLPNAAVSAPIGTALLNQLKTMFPISDRMRELSGLVEDQQLIALGANRTLNSTVASVVIEYGYIYENAWLNPATRPLALKELAYQTYVGIKKYFEPAWKDPNPVVLYQWTHQLEINPYGDSQVFALQVALSRHGFYPPAELFPNDCPLSGIFGRCTRKAVLNFQNANKLPRTGIVDAATLKKINQVYSASISELVR